MKTTDSVNYICDKGKTFRRNSDGMIMGNNLSLGENDSIENYEEVVDESFVGKKETKYRRVRK